MKSSDLNGKTILLDSDVVRHFLRGGAFPVLSKLFAENLYLLDVVENELKRSKSLRTEVENLLNFKLVKSYIFPTDDAAIVSEFSKLTSGGMGIGESACLAVARHRQHVVASSNFKDIRVYCEQHKLMYIGTMDILMIALEEKKMEKGDCDAFIGEIIRLGGKLPCQTIERYYQLNGKSMAT